MALNDANIRAVITAEDRASAVLDKFGDKANGIGGVVASAFKVAAEAALVATGAAAGFATLSLKAYADAEAQTAQVNQVLQTTGKISQISTKQVEALAMEMEHYSGKTHDAIEAGQTILLQFSEVSSKNLPQMTKAMLDLSQRMGIDTVTAAKTLGIALDNPTLGMTRLKRAGIDFTAAQVEQVKTMQKAGDLAGAQAILMAGLESKVGGAAGAYRNTLAGSISSARASLKDMEITVGETISKSLEPLAAKAALALSKIDWQQVINDTITAIRNFIHNVDSLWQVINKFYQLLDKLFGPSLKALWHSIQENLLPTLKHLYDAVEPGLNEILKVLAVIIGVAIVASIYVFINALNIATKWLGGIISVISDVIGWIGTFVSAFWGAAVGVKNAFGSLVGVISGVFRGEFNLIIRLWNDTLGKINFTIPKWVPVVGGDSFGFPHITPFAEGGIVTKPTLAMIGEAGPEAVVPLGKGGVGGINITIQTGMLMASDIEARKMAKVMYKHLQDLAGSKNMSIAEMMG